MSDVTTTLTPKNKFFGDIEIFQRKMLRWALN
jgi:hypothetical protein